MPGFCTSAPAAPENSVAQRTRAMAPRPFMVAAAVGNVVPGGEKAGRDLGAWTRRCGAYIRPEKLGFRDTVFPETKIMCGLIWSPSPAIEADRLKAWMQFCQQAVHMRAWMREGQESTRGLT